MSKQSTAFDLTRAERQAFFIASSLESLYESMPEEMEGARVSAKFLVFSLAMLAQQLGVALMDEDTSRLMPGTMGEANHYE
jgi:hypothetical protein